jgi:FtsZ-binding cell division protein ZapB
MTTQTAPIQPQPVEAAAAAPVQPPVAAAAAPVPTTQTVAELIAGLQSQVKELKDRIEELESDNQDLSGENDELEKKIEHFRGGYAIQEAIAELLDFDPNRLTVFDIAAIRDFVRELTSR